MLSYSSAFYDLKNKLQALYDEREAVAIAHEVMQHLTGLDKMQRSSQKDTLFTGQQEQKFEEMSTDLLKGRPLQYITGSAWFMGKEFYVNEHVLIPRPETEELVQWIIPDSRFQIPNLSADRHDPRILDIGTGSGCIPILLKLALPDASITSCDISTDALQVARENANRLGASVDFIQLDFLDTPSRNRLGKFDIIVSNPPYIPFSEKADMHRNVKDFEPANALFVPDEDPLVFYQAIAAFGKEHLAPGGTIYCELSAGLASDTKAIFENAGYKNVTIKKDMHGNWRMLKCEC